MGYSVEEVVFDCWCVVNVNMIQVICRIMAGKGIDFKEMVMLVYGGNGFVFVVVYVDVLGIEKVLVLKVLFIFFVLGILVVKFMIDEECFCNCFVGSFDLDIMKIMW